MIGVPGGGGSLFGRPAMGRTFGPNEFVLAAVTLTKARKASHLSTLSASTEKVSAALSPEMHC